MPVSIITLAIFDIYLEDHTLGNILQSELLKDLDVVFAGYKRPHPLVNKIIVNVQTNNNSKPTDAMHKAINNLTTNITSLARTFD